MKIVNGLILIVISAFSLMLIVDIVGVINNPEDYRIAQGFSEESLSIKSPSVRNYIIKEIALLAVMITVGVLGIYYHKNKLIPTAKYIYYGLIIVFVLVLVLGYFKWASTGFDH